MALTLHAHAHNAPSVTSARQGVHPVLSSRAAARAKQASPGFNEFRCTRVFFFCLSLSEGLLRLASDSQIRHEREASPSPALPCGAPPPAEPGLSVPVYLQSSVRVERAPPQLQGGVCSWSLGKGRGPYGVQGDQQRGRGLLSVLSSECGVACCAWVLCPETERQFGPALYYAVTGIEHQRDASSTKHSGLLN